MSGGVHSNPRVNPTIETVVGVVTADQGAPNTLANAWPVEVTDGTNTMPTADANTRALFVRITDGTTNLPVGQATVTTSMPVNTQMESVIYDLSGNSPAAAGTVAGNATSIDLSDHAAISAFVTLQGATGGTLDVYLQVSPDGGTTYVDWVHFTQLINGASAISYLFVPAFSGAITVVGSGTSPALGNGLSSNGSWFGKIRVLFVAGGGTSAGAAQTIKIFATRPKK